MKKRLVFTLLMPLLGGSYAVTAASPEVQPTVAITAEQINTETLDAVLAPIALYPDSVITHILIASTYPLQVIEADRWRQANLDLEDEGLASALEQFNWDPSIKALAPFSEILRNMSDDLTWLQTLGDAVITQESRVLDRIQALRLLALESGNLETNDYQQVTTDQQIVIVESRSPEVVYIPYYNPHVVYGHWLYRTHPTLWSTALHIAAHHVFWQPRVSVSASFHFGRIWWPEHHIVISRKPVRHYTQFSRSQRYSVNEYRRWSHNSSKRYARYSKHVTKSKPKVVKQHRILANKNVKFAENSKPVKKQSVKRSEKSVHNTATKKQVNYQARSKPERQQYSAKKIKAQQSQSA